MTFGARFGALIRQKRESEGISAGELALRALGDMAKRSRISDLENGKVKRPQAKTIEALCNYFDLAVDDVEACRVPPPEPQSDLPPDTGLPNELLENLAQRFGIENPDQPPAALAAFLKDKAKDYQKLKTDMAALPKDDERESNVRAAAEVAIQEGNFEEARARLDDAIEIEIRDHALVSARKAAGLLNLKAGSYLLEGDAAAAATEFQRGADMVRPFDGLEFGRMRSEAGGNLFTHGLRYGGPGLALAVEAYEAAIEVYTRANHPVDWAMTQNNLAVALGNQGTRLGGEEGVHLLGRSVEAYEAAIEVYTRADHPVQWAMTQNNLAIALGDQGERLGGEEGVHLLGRSVEAYEAAIEVYTRADHPVDWAMTQNNLAIALRNQGTRLGGEEGVHLLGRSVEAYEAALEVRTRADHPVQWAMTQNNLAVALGNQGTRLGGEEGVHLLGRSVEACEAALEVYTRADHPVQWAMTQNNLAIALRNQGARLGGEEGVHLLGRSVEAYEAAIEVYTRADHPVDWATTQNNLAIALRNQGERLGGEEGVHLLGRSVEAYEAALEVRTRADHPVQWAMTRENLALVYENLSGLDGENEKDYLQSALLALKDALTVFDPEHMQFNFDKASSAQTRIETKLAALE